LDWFVETCAGGADRGECRSRLESEAATLPVGSGGLLALPYWGAVMTPYWDPDARGCFVGLTAAHGAAHMYRALLEGIALEQALVTQMIEREAGVRVEEFVVMGGGAASPLWLEIIADASGKPLKRARTAEASSLGAAMCAAAGAGWFPNVAAAAEGMCGEVTDAAEPSADRTARYGELLEIYREIYPQMRDTCGRIAAFQRSHRGV
jgi:xylulokinase